MLQVGSVVEVKKDQSKYVEGTIVKITDQSMYTVGEAELLTVDSHRVYIICFKTCLIVVHLIFSV